jgi:hypothetical protein
LHGRTAPITLAQDTLYSLLTAIQSFRSGRSKSRKRADGSIL